MTITTLGIDLSKNIFQLHGVDERGKAVLKKKLRRNELMKLIANLSPCLIGVESCSTANFWSRQFKKHGHTVKQMPPQYVKPFVKTNKNDPNDAEAICEAVQRPNMHFVPDKTIAQQDIQSAHRIRSRLVRVRTALSNEMRGLLSEYGVSLPVGIKTLKKRIPEVLADETNDLTAFTRELISGLVNELIEVESHIALFDQKIKGVFDSSEICKRLSKIEGVGPITATAIIASVGDPSVFKNGRQMAAWIGLVPRQSSSGGKTTLLGISKRGDCYLRSLLIHGGRSVVRDAAKKDDSRSRWVAEKATMRGKNKAAVAVANKNARIIWKMMKSGEAYRPAA